jgi:hypothetical protein
MFINFTDIINNFINNIKSIFLEDYQDKQSSKIFQDLFNNIYEERCKNIHTEFLPDVLPIVDDIYVIGDIHGDYDKLIQLLIKSNLISILELNNNNEFNNSDKHVNIIEIENRKVIQDNNNIIKWIGGKSVVVQVGDQIDRCRDKNNCDSSNDDKNDDWKILKFMTLLNILSNQDNGKVYSLLGNHEIMNTQLNFRYVSKKGIDDFYNDYDKDYLKHFRNNNKDKDTSKYRQDVFKIGNEISNFLACTRKLCIIIGSNVFVHGGITSSIAQKYNVTDMNTIVNLYLFDSLKLSDLNNNKEIKNIADTAINNLLSINHNSFINYEKSPIWNRDLNNLILDINKDEKIPKWIRDLNNVVPEKNCKDIDDYLKIFINNSKNKVSPLDKNIISPLDKNTVVKVGSIIVGHTPQLNSGRIKSRCNNKVWLTDYGSSVAFKRFKKTTLPEIQVLHIHKDNNFNIIS